MSQRNIKPQDDVYGAVTKTNRNMTDIYARLGQSNPDFIVSENEPRNAITGTVWYEEKGGEEEDGAVPYDPDQLRIVTSESPPLHPGSSTYWFHIQSTTSTVLSVKCKKWDPYSSTWMEVRFV